VIFPAWRQYEIASCHLDPLAMNGSESATSFNDEANGKSCVAVRWRCLSWQY